MQRLDGSSGGDTAGVQACGPQGLTLAGQARRRRRVPSQAGAGSRQQRARAREQAIRGKSRGRARRDARSSVRRSRRSPPPRPRALGRAATSLSRRSGSRDVLLAASIGTRGRFVHWRTARAGAHRPTTMTLRTRQQDTEPRQPRRRRGHCRDADRHHAAGKALRPDRPHHDDDACPRRAAANRRQRARCQRPAVRAVTPILAAARPQRRQVRGWQAASLPMPRAR